MQDEYRKDEYEMAEAMYDLITRSVGALNNTISTYHNIGTMVHGFFDAPKWSTTNAVALDLTMFNEELRQKSILVLYSAFQTTFVKMYMAAVELNDNNEVITHRKMPTPEIARTKHGTKVIINVGTADRTIIGQCPIKLDDGLPCGLGELKLFCPDEKLVENSEDNDMLPTGELDKIIKTANIAAGLLIPITYLKQTGCLEAAILEEARKKAKRMFDSGKTGPEVFEDLLIHLIKNYDPRLAPMIGSLVGADVKSIHNILKTMSNVNLH